VLFGDIAGFTAISEKLDPEDLGGIVRRGFELITAEIHRFEGTINQYGGDGLMALFGAPIAHDSTHKSIAGYFETLEIGETKSGDTLQYARSKFCARTAAAHGWTWRWSADLHP
jgi:class 3 adenylate cyclase